MWLIFLGIFIIMLWLLTWDPVAKVVAPMIGMEPGQLQDTAFNLILLATGGVLLLVALGALSAVPIAGVLLAVAGAALIITGAWSLFKYWSKDDSGS